MKDGCTKNICEKNKIILYKDGKIYFSKKTERKIFFVLTIIMLIAGIFAKLDLF